jgi:Domain of unknown function (DUF4157)
MNGKTQTTTQDQAPPAAAVTKQPERPAKAAGPSQVFRVATGSQPPPTSNPRNAQTSLSGDAGTLSRARLMRSMQGTVGNSWIGRQFDSAAPSQPAPQPRRPIQRKCNCAGGGNGGANGGGNGGGSCSECGGAKVQTVQRQASDTNTDTDSPSSVPQSVTQVMESSGGQPLPRSTRNEMESAFGVDFGQARIHTGQQAATAARDINASAFTVDQDIYFGEGQYQPDSQQGKHLLAHELTHTLQQANGRSALQSDAVVSHPDDVLEREADSVADAVSQDRLVSRQVSPGAPQIQRYSLDEFAADVGSVVDDIEEGAQAVGEVVTGTAEAVGEAVSEGIDTVTAWIDTAAGQAAIAAAGAIASAFGGTIRIVGGVIEITIPDITIFDRISHTLPWNDATENIEIFQTMFEVPYIGPVFLTIYGRGEVSAAVSVGLGPGKLQNMVLTLDPVSGYYSGTGQLYAPAEVDGALTLTGVLGAAANWLCLLEVIRIEGGLSVTGSAGLSTELIDTATITYSSGEFQFDNQLSLDTCLEFGFSLDGLMNIFILNYPIWNGLWNITGATWDKCWPISIGGPEPGQGGGGYQGGGGRSGGGGATGSFDEAPGASAAVGGGGASGTSGLTGGGSAPAGDQSGFTASALLSNLLSGSDPEIKLIPLPLDAAEKGKLDELCEIEDKKPCDDPLPIRWPRKLPLPPESPPLQRRGSGEWDGDDRGPAQRRMQEEIRRNRDRGIPPPSPCFDDDAEPNAPYDAHHMQPLYLNGKDQEFNLCALETGRHQRGHAELDDQRDMVDSDPIWIACKVKEGRLRFHPVGQMYEIQGRK